jgi:hypothetical protein
MNLGEMGWGDVDWIGLAVDRDKWRGSCECSKEALSSMKCYETIKWLCNWWPLEKCSAQ